jgi:hypothetical protein
MSRSSAVNISLIQCLKEMYEKFKFSLATSHLLNSHLKHRTDYHLPSTATEAGVVIYSINTVSSM